MRIGIDLSVVNQQMTGVPRYAFLLAKYLLALNTEHEFVFFIRGNLSLALPSPGEGRKVDVVKLPQKGFPLWSRHVTFARRIEKAKLDVFHGTANTLPLTQTLSRKGRGVKYIITIHDLAIYRHPEWFPRGQWFATRFVVPRSIRRADKIIVPSEVTKKDLVEMFGVGKEKIAVVPLGVEERFFGKNDPAILSPSADADGKEPRSFACAQDDKVGKKYILFVGTLEPRKNVKGVIEAYGLLPEEVRAEYQLWIAGLDIGHCLPVPALPAGRWQAGTLDIPDGVRVLGYVPDEQLPGLYQNASVFVYPSFYEGFGLPVLEAMAAGVPIVTSKDSAMAEIVTSPQPSPISEREPRAGREAGEVSDIAVLIDPHSPKEIADAILKNLSPREYAGSLSSSGESDKVASHSRYDAYMSQKIERGIQRAREYSWARTAVETMKVYENI